MTGGAGSELDATGGFVSRSRRRTASAATFSNIPSVRLEQEAQTFGSLERVAPRVDMGSPQQMQMVDFT
jgi:hypothetical protein